MTHNVVSIFEGQKRKTSEAVREELVELARLANPDFADVFPPALLRDAATMVVNAFEKRATLDNEMEFLGVSFCYGMVVAKLSEYEGGINVPADRLKALAFDMLMIGDKFFPH